MLKAGVVFWLNYCRLLSEPEYSPDLGGRPAMFMGAGEVSDYGRIYG